MSSRKDKLFEACKTGNIEDVKRSFVPFLFLRGANVNVKKGDGSTPLIIASENGFKEIVDFLITKGADVNSTNSAGASPLIMALDQGFKEVAKLLIAKNADVNTKSNKGNTPLILASNAGFKDIVKLLIAKHADVNAINNDGTTPLILASENGFEDIADFLIANGADVNAMNKKGNTPLSRASYMGFKRIVKLLISKGANVNQKNSDGDTPLILVSYQGFDSIAELLVAKSADVNAKNNNGNSPLTVASANGFKYMADLFITKGADVNATTNLGNTSLILALDSGFKEIVKLLIAKGADVNVKNNKGNTPMDFAASNKYEEIVKLLIAKGAVSKASADIGGSSLIKATDKNVDKTFQSVNTSPIDILIEKLSLRPPVLALIHPETQIAIDAIKQRGKTALQPLLQALQHSNEDVRAWVIYLLGNIEDKKAIILPIAKQLKDNSPKVKNEALGVLENFATEDISDSNVVIHLKQATSDADIQVRKGAKELLERIGVLTTDVPWYTGANTWKQLSDAFIQFEIFKPIPDYQGLGQKLQKYSADERHAVWAFVGSATRMIDRNKSIRCYIEALYNDPDPNSTVWNILKGSVDKKMNILPPESAKKRDVIEKMRAKYEPIIE